MEIRLHLLTSFRYYFDTFITVSSFSDLIWRLLIREFAIRGRVNTVVTPLRIFVEVSSGALLRASRHLTDAGAHALRSFIGRILATLFCRLGFFAASLRSACTFL